MTPESKSRNGFPLAIGDALVRIGERVRLARTRRGITQAEMAARMFVTRKTLSRLEKGELGVSLAVLGSALWVLGLESGLQEIANWPAMPRASGTLTFAIQRRPRANAEPTTLQPTQGYYPGRREGGERRHL